MVGTLAWSPDGRFIALGDVDDETLSKGGIQVIDAASRAVVASLETGNVPRRCAGVRGRSRDGRRHPRPRPARLERRCPQGPLNSSR